MVTRIGSKKERAKILIHLTRQLIDTECKDLEVLKQVDRLCRRTWEDLHVGWVRWANYIETVIGRDKYDEWAKQNCDRVNE